MKNINLNAIRIDGGTQSRVALSQETVADYRQVLADGGELPPVDLFFDGAELWLGDGFHRYFAYKADERASIPANVRAGTQREAVLFACGSNAEHGLRRTNDDKRKAVETLLGDAEWGQWSDRRIAEVCAVSDKTVARHRAAIIGNSADAPTERVVERGGVEYRQKVKAKRERAPEPEPDPDLREDPAELLAEQQRELERMSALVKAAEADDSTAEVVKWRRAAEVATRRQGELMETIAGKDRELQAQGRILQRICKAVGEEDPTKVAAVVEQHYRSLRKVAA